MIGMRVRYLRVEERATHTPRGTVLPQAYQSSLFEVKVSLRGTRVIQSEGRARRGDSTAPAAERAPGSVAARRIHTGHGRSRRSSLTGEMRLIGTPPIVQNVKRNPSCTKRWKFDCPVELRLIRPKSALPVSPLY